MPSSKETQGGSDAKPATNPNPTAPVSIIVVERNGDLRISQIKECSQLELCKKCKYKSSIGFELRAEWAYSGQDQDKFIVELWAREDGNAGKENKYEFPPPVDTILFFGACALVAKDMTSCIIPLTLEKWDKMYNFLFGGFDTLVNSDEDAEFEEDTLDSIAAIRKTKDGYLKDGFVVDNNDDDDDTDDEDTDYEEEEEEEDTATETDDEKYDDDNDDNDDDDDDADDDVTDNADESDLKKKCNGINHKVIAKKSTPKKRNPRQPKDEIIGTSFELLEESYEYLDD